MKKTLPDGVLEGAFRRMETGGGFDALKAHPDYKMQQEAEGRAYKILEARLTREELSAVESAFNWSAGLHYKTGYACGLHDGVATSKALGEARGN